MKSSSYFLLSLFLFLFISCKKDNVSSDLLKKAQQVIDNDPATALTLLDSIDLPEDMEYDSYMQYIIAHVRAKSKISQKVTSDTIIFEAERYFENKNNPEQAMLAHFYAGAVNNEIKRYNKSLTSFLKSAEYAQKMTNNKLSGSIFEYIGYIYVEQGLMDSAIVNYKKAENYYNIEKNAPSLLRVTNQIGRAYEDISKLDSAYIYFSNALQIAEKLNNEWYKSNITQNLAVTTYRMGEYEKAIKYYRSVLDMQATNASQRKQVYLSLLKIYNIKQDSNAAKEYALKVEASLPEVTFIHTTKEMYAALAEYYKMLGDYKQALHFKELESETKDQIAKEERPIEMIQADTKFRIEQKDRQYDRIKSDLYLYLSFVILFMILTSICALLAWKQNRKDKNILRLQEEKYNRFRECLKEMNSNYPELEAEIKAMLEDTESDKE